MNALPDDRFDALFSWNGPLGLPEFERIADNDFKDAFAVALDQHLGQIDEIAEATAEPDFDNVVVALEEAGGNLERLARLFFSRASTDSNAVIQDVERHIAPVLARHYSAIGMNRALFDRLDRLWRQVDDLDLDREQFRLLERLWKGFVRSGAQLDDDGQKALAKINAELATLGTEFAQNVLAEESHYALFLTGESELAGLPANLRDSMRAAARERGREDAFAVTLSRSIIEPFLVFSERRDLREQAFQAWISRGRNGDDRDNREIITKTLRLRHEKATLLGYESYAALKLQDTMAKNAGNVTGLLENVWEKARTRALEETGDLAALVREAGGNYDLAPWDWRHYAEKLRQTRFDFDAAEIKAYFVLDAMIAAAFDVAGNLFGVTFTERTDIKAYHPDVRAFEMKDKDGKRKGVFLGDYFARSSKRSGAWMSAFKDGHRLKDGGYPIVFNVMNFAKAPEGEKTLLSLDDARTLFHEFGHALHGLLSDVTYPSLAGTSVARDFVELPSQLFEHWLSEPQILQKHARHFETGEPIPDDLMKKLQAARNFNAGFAAVEYTASALIDMEFHGADAAEIGDPLAREKEVLQRIAMPDAIVPRHAAPHFAHVFSGDGYAAGYYSYMWSEVLDADAFAAFTEKGDIYDPDVAARLKRFIYSSGGSMDPEDAYTEFRGRMPTPDAMLAKKGLIVPLPEGEL